MKSFIVALCAFAALLSCMFIYSVNVSRLSDEMRGFLDDYVESVHAENWDESQQKAQGMNEFFQKNRTVLTVLAHHTDVDAIELVFAQINQMTQFHDRQEIIRFTSKLYLLIDSLQKKDSFCLENLL